MKIAIDLDWTLAEHGDFWGDFFKLGRKMKRNEAYGLVTANAFEVLGLTPADLWIHRHPELTDPMWPHAIRILRGLGYRVYVVSNQREEVRYYVEKWLKAKRIEVDGVELIGLEEPKDGYDVLVDDGMEKLVDVFEKIEQGFLWCSDFDGEELEILDLVLAEKTGSKIRVVSSAMEVVLLLSMRRHK